MYSYQFENFILSNDSYLYHDDVLCSVPPKELSVLKLLVSKAESVVSKEDIINDVWKGGCVSDESLTRCIYVLRKLLGEKTGHVFISTIYGKGYRFAKKVNVIEGSPPASRIDSNKCLVAMFPFTMEDAQQSLMTHDYLLFHANNLQSNCEVRFISSALTTDTFNLAEKFTNLSNLGVNFFITGSEIIYDKGKLIRIEAVESLTRAVVLRKAVVITEDNILNLINYRNAIHSILEEITHRDFFDNTDYVSYEIDFFNNEMISPSGFSMESLENLDNQVLVVDKSDVNELCHLARCYLSLTTFGLADKNKCLETVKYLTGLALSKDDSNALALSMNALATESNDEKMSEDVFELALMLSPNVAEVYYYYALYLVNKLNYDKAFRVNEFAIYLDANAYAPKILSMFIRLLAGDVAQAETIGRDLLGQNDLCEIIINSMLALVYAKTGQEDELSACLVFINAYRQSVFVDYCYIQAVETFHRQYRTPGKEIRQVSNIRITHHHSFFLPKLATSFDENR